MCVVEELLQPLSDYIARTWPDGIVRQVRTEKREGLIAARQIGAHAALGDVMIFLDAHCEVTKGWSVLAFLFRVTLIFACSLCVTVLRIYY